MIRSLQIACAAVLVLASCAAARPLSLVELRELSTDTRAEMAKTESPVSFGEGMRYLSMAESALEKGDERQADRLAGLGVIQMKIALAGAEQAMARKRLEAGMEKKRSIDEELERVRADVENMEADRERNIIRKHIVSVVDETRRRAAAADELYEEKLSKDEKKEMMDARRRIGREMLARIVLWRDILNALVKEGVLSSDRTAVIESEIKLAEKELEDLDLAELQHHVENAGIEARHLLDEAWEGKEQDREARTKEIAENLSGVGSRIVQEEFGQAILIEAPLSKSGKADKRWVESLGDLGVRLKEIHRVHLLILASTDLSRPDKAMKSSFDRADAAAKAIADAGFPKANLTVHACGATSPLEALKDRVAVLLIPLP
jgi:hypothetical protein